MGGDSEGATLTVKVTGLEHERGRVFVALYAESKKWLKKDGAVRSEIVVAESGACTAVFKDLPAGTYAASVFHDENDNGTLDTNILGIPNEGIGFSMARIGRFGPPNFKKASFEVGADGLALTVELTY